MHRFEKTFYNHENKRLKLAGKRDKNYFEYTAHSF